MRTKVALQAQQAELDRLTAQLAESLAAVSASAGVGRGVRADHGGQPAGVAASAVHARSGRRVPRPSVERARRHRAGRDRSRPEQERLERGRDGSDAVHAGDVGRVRVDGDGDGVADILDQADAIYSAAHYLCADGGGDARTLYQAIFAYNHSDYYVNTVLAVAAQYH